MANATKDAMRRYLAQDKSDDKAAGEKESPQEEISDQREVTNLMRKKAQR